MNMTYTLALSEQELQALAGLIDAGVKATGIRSVKEATLLLNKLEEAIEEKRKQN